MSRGKSSLRAKDISDGRILPELLLENLADVSDDILSDTVSDDHGRDSVTERKIVWPEKNYSDSETKLQ
jgi:hypothetical protein